MNENYQHDLLLKKNFSCKNEKKPFEKLLNEKEKVHNLNERKKEIIKRIDDQISKDVILFDRPPKKSQKGEEEAKGENQNNSFEKEYKQLNTLLSKTKINPENHLLYLDELLKTKIENERNKQKKDNSEDPIRDDDKIEADILTFKNLFNKSPNHSFQESTEFSKTKNSFEKKCKHEKKIDSNFEIKRSEFFDEDIDDFYAIMNEDINNLMNKDKLFLK